MNLSRAYALKGQFGEALKQLELSETVAHL
jgi:hypothetical protein